MKRSPLVRRTPLTARTPLQRGEPLRRSAGTRTNPAPAQGSTLPQRPKAIAPRSEKASRRAPERKLFVARILTARPWCEWRTEDDVCRRPAEDVHEKWPRGRGGPYVPSEGLTDEGVMALCRRHHDWIHHEHPAEATRLGYLRSSL